MKSLFEVFLTARLPGKKKTNTFCICIESVSMSAMVLWVKRSSLHQLIVHLYHLGTDSLGHSSLLQKMFGVAVWNIIALETLAPIVQE